MSPSKVGTTLSSEQRENALATLTAEAAKQNFGKKDPYNLDQGVREYCRDFLVKNVPIGCYDLKGSLVIFINDHLLPEEHQPLLKQVNLQRTDAPGIYSLIPGTLRVRKPESEPVTDSYRAEGRD